MASVRLVVKRAAQEDAGPIAQLLEAAAQKLTEDFGEGAWSRATTLRTLRGAVEEGTLHVVCADDAIVGTFRVGATRIPFYRKEWFHNPDAPALYLRDMAIAPGSQRKGIGRATMTEIDAIARECGLKAVRFDAYEGPAGAGTFYQKCGYSQVHRGLVGDVPLEYYEKVLD